MQQQLILLQKSFCMLKHRTWSLLVLRGQNLHMFIIPVVIILFRDIRQQNHASSFRLWIVTCCVWLHCSCHYLWVAGACHGCQVRLRRGNRYCLAAGPLRRRLLPAGGCQGLTEGCQPHTASITTEMGKYSHPSLILFHFLSIFQMNPHF